MIHTLPIGTRVRCLIRISHEPGQRSIEPGDLGTVYDHMTGLLGYHYGVRWDTDPYADGDAIAMRITEIEPTD